MTSRVVAKKRWNRGERGVSLVEALVAMVLVAAAAALAESSFRKNNDARGEFKAYHGARRVEEFVRIEATRALYNAVEGAAVANNACVATLRPSAIGANDAMSFGDMAPVSSGAPTAWRDMAARCKAKNGISGSSGHMCSTLTFVDPYLKQQTPEIYVEFTLYLKSQVTDQPLACTAYRKSKVDRSFDVYYTIYYKQLWGRYTEYRQVSGRYFAGGDNKF